MNICPTCNKQILNRGSFKQHARGCSRLGEYFWPKVDRRGPDECWLYTGRKDASGYGRYGKQGPNTYPHRIAWRLANGPIPTDLEVAHRCDVRACCNPAHLFLATHDENMADCRLKGRGARGERSGQAKLTEVKVRDIRARYRRGNAKELAAEFGVSHGAVCDIVARRLWAHVE